MTEVVALCAFAFLAGLVDAVAGGGGLIQVPALFAIFPSAPPPILLGTNKFSAITGTTIATLRYGWSVPIRWQVVLPAAGIAAIGALAGAKTVTLINPAILRPLLLGLLSGMAVYTLTRPKFGENPEAAAPLKQGGTSFYAATAVFGFYDGFFGPGAGSLMMFALVRLFGYDFLSAAATTKVLNLATNFGALALFVVTGNVLYAVALPMAAFNIAGGFLGAHFAIRRGSRFIRTVFLVVVAILIVKVLLDLPKSF
ncbi:MAG: TSUP family transporter [Betaproteobacteria bacterium]|nr:TSUP family transporter [Betaproteobacteria bacterium]